MLGMTTVTMLFDFQQVSYGLPFAWPSHKTIIINQVADGAINCVASAGETINIGSSSTVNAVNDQQSVSQNWVSGNGCEGSASVVTNVSTETTNVINVRGKVINNFY